MALRIEVFIERKDNLGEGPLWDVTEERLYWLDSYGPAVHRCDPNGGDRRTWPLPEPVGALALRKNGGAVVALRSGFHFLDFDSGEVSRINETHPGEIRVRMNDGKVDRQGRFIAGSMDVEERDGLGKLYRLDPDLSLHTLDTGIVISNGPCWSVDGKTLYFSDTGKRLVYAYDYDTATGALQSRSVFTSFEKMRGAPDGATVDAEGYVWSVEVFSGRLFRFDPDGVLDRVVGLPVQSTTSITFGGPNLDIAYITSMARPLGYQHALEYEAGCVFAIHGLGVEGVPESRFAG